jgi:cytochrome c oxidase subunit 2
VPSGQDLDAIPVIHSFWVPRLGGKQDMVPGRTHHMTLEADRPGTYLGQCAEFCGLSHANMRFRVVAESDAAFDAWAQRMKAPVEPPVEGTLEAEGAALFNEFVTGRFPDGFSCLACHVVDANLPEKQTPTVGPNLAGFGSRQTLGAGIYDNNEANLKRWLDDPRAMKPGAIMPDYGLSEEQIEALAAYLLSLR